MENKSDVSITFHISEELQDIIRVSGIKAKGYGVLPKYVMLDAEISLEAKGIYAYFCSYTGNGTNAFPSRETILRQLQLSKNGYYPHFQQLKDAGYISVAQEQREHKFTCNVYTIESNPKKFKEEAADSQREKLYSKIRFSGLESVGYGMIPKAVFLDNRLPLQSKSIYAYLCSFTGSGNNAFPRLKVLLYHLGITNKTYYKYVSYLEKFNYLSKKQRQVNGRLSVSDYYLNTNPDESNATSGHVIVVDTTQKQLCKIEDTAQLSSKKQLCKKEDTPKEDAPNEDTNNNSTIINSSEHQSINQNPALPGDRWIEVLQDDDLIDSVFDVLYKEGLPYTFKKAKEERKRIAAIYTLTEYDIMRNRGFSDEYKQAAYELAVECLIDLCSFDGYKTLNKQNIHYARVYDKINACIERGDGQGAYVTIFYVIDSAVDDYCAALKEKEIRNPFGYMQACIWTAFSTAKEKLHNILAMDGLI